MKVYFNKLSNNCQKVLWTARLIGVELEVQELDFRTDLQTEAYLAINPSGKIPAIDDDGFVLWESNAVMKYIARKNKSPLYPADLRQRAQVDQWVDFSTMHVSLSMSKVAFNRAWAPMIGLPVNEAAITEGEEVLKKHLPVVEGQLQQVPFLAGEEVSLADIALLAATYYADVAKVDLSGYPALVAWRAKMMEQVGAEPARLG